MGILKLFKSHGRSQGSLISKDVDVWADKTFSWMGIRELAKNKLISDLVKYPPELPCIRDNRSEEYTIIYEPDFEKIIYTWKDNTLDATWFALKIFHALVSYEMPDETRRKLIQSIEEAKQTAADLLRKCIKYGLFVVSPNGNAPSLHSIHSALGVLIALGTPTEEECNWNTPKGRESIQGTLSKVLENETEAAAILDKSLAYVNACWKNAFPYANGHSGSDVAAGYADTVGDMFPSITASASALWILWQLDAINPSRENNILTFCKKMLHKRSPDDGYVGFVNSPKDTEALICSTYYAMRILFSLSHSDTASGAVHKFTTENKDIIKQFIIENTNGMGFAPKIGAVPTIIHTKDAFALMQPKYNLFEFKKTITIEKVRHAIQNIKKFWNSCSLDGTTPLVGFSSHSFFYPNIYATLLLIEIDRYITRIIQENTCLSLNYDAAINASNIDTVIDYLNSCTMPPQAPKRQPGFRCYSYSPLYLPDSFLDRISR